jgi:hypothetical protein
LLAHRSGDQDADGYGATASPTKYCGTTIGPPGYLSSKKDCCDSDALASPEQTELFFRTANACGSYDYDCNGGLTREFLLGQTACDPRARSCSVEAFGFDSEVPGCGESGPFIKSCFYDPAANACGNVLGTRIQRCR